jgi:hypothetical protein
MKTKLPLIAAIYCGLSTFSSALTLDFTSVTLGTNVPPNLVINVPGYGDVTFSQLSGTTTVNNFFPIPIPGTLPSLSFDAGDSINVNFGGTVPINVQFGLVGEDLGEFFTISRPDAHNFLVTLSGPAMFPAEAGASVYEVSFNNVPVPEPSSALLGVLGASLLVIRRRR